MYTETLKLVAGLGERRPTLVLPFRLDQLFAHLAVPDCPAGEVEEEIWRLWMHHPHRRAALVLDRASSDIAAHRFDIAETRLESLLRACPDFPEAWNKRATLYYLQARDEESVHDIHRTLELEPRHFGALCGLGEICLSAGDRDEALFVFQTALRLNPHLSGVRSVVDQLLSERQDSLH
jgi:tetratricopeptide (TPR) repeat protein